MRPVFATLSVALRILNACTSSDSLHQWMSRAAQPGQGLQQTQLAHIGHVRTADGRLEVCFQRLVIKGMMAPRGQSRLVLFSAHGDVVRSYRFPDFDSPPLWCESGRVYLFGYARIPEIPIDPAIACRFASDELPSGNVIDFSRGVSGAVLTREKRYGSSGGVEDEIWPAQ